MRRSRTNLHIWPPQPLSHGESSVTWHGIVLELGIQMEYLENRSIWQTGRLDRQRGRKESVYSCRQQLLMYCSMLTDHHGDRKLPSWRHCIYESLLFKYSATTSPFSNI